MVVKCIAVPQQAGLLMRSVHGHSRLIGPSLSVMILTPTTSKMPHCIPTKCTTSSKATDWVVVEAKTFATQRKLQPARWNPWWFNELRRAGYAAGAGARKGNIQSGDAGGAIGAGAKDANNKADDASDADADAEQGYAALQAQGMSHQEIVLEMSRRVLRAMDEQAEWKHIRQGHNKGFL